MKRLSAIIISIILMLLLFGCGAKKTAAEDGTYDISVTMTGGSGKASIQSPTQITIKDGSMTAKIVWSSAKYDYMIVDGEKLLPEITDGHSVFEIKVAELDKDFIVTADTTAMSTPHEIEYTLNFDSSSMKLHNEG